LILVNYFKEFKVGKNAHKSKTLWFGSMLVIFGALSANLPLLQAHIDGEIYGYLMVGVGIITAWLRYKTSEPIK
jgi:hypothetical protein